jgi:hypothetical protein
MDQVGALLGGFALLGLTVEGIIRKIEKSSRKFPWCWTCGRHMQASERPMLMPGEVSNHLGKHGLPTGAASLFICPKGHYRLWYVPGFGETEKPFFLREGL